MNNILFRLNVGYYYSDIIQEDVLNEFGTPIIRAYQVPNRGDILKKSMEFCLDVDKEVTIEYTLEVQSVHYIIDDNDEAIIEVYANVINENVIREDSF